MIRRHQIIEIAEVRCSIGFDDGSFHDTFQAMLSNYRRGGFCTEGKAEIIIIVKKGSVPRPSLPAEHIFYYSTDYASLSAAMVFDALELKGEIGITARQPHVFTPVRVMELIETFVCTAYIFYFFFRGKGAFIHSCGIFDREAGYIFAGPSGNGKSTIAKLSHPRTVLCDDLVVLRKNGGGRAKVFGTPFPGDAESINRGAECAALFFIEQSTTHELIPVTRMAAVTELIKEGIIGNFVSLPEIERVIPYSKLLSHLIELLDGVPCFKLRFRKDGSFWEVIHEQQRQTAEKT